MSKKLTTLFIPMNALGHLNPLIGFGQNLVPKHRVVFAVSKKSKGQLTKYGFEETDLNIEDTFFNMDKDKMKEFTKEKKFLEERTPMEGWKHLVEEDFFMKLAQLSDSAAKEVVERVKPDLLVMDCTFILPSAIKAHQGPWINLILPNPNTVLLEETSPPPGLGN